jgi:hypothetical protein
MGSRTCLVDLLVSVVWIVACLRFMWDVRQPKTELPFRVGPTGWYLTGSGNNRFVGEDSYSGPDLVAVEGPQSLALRQMV